MKKIYQMPPCSNYDIPAMETWLADMAQKGWHLQKAGRRYLCFHKGTGSHTRYRLEPAANDYGNPSCERQEFYLSAGWEFVTTAYRSFYIWRSTRSDADELHSDPIVQSVDYEQLCRRLERNAAAVSAAVIAFLAMLIGVFTLSRHPVRIFLTTAWVFVVMVMDAALAIQAIIQVVRLLSLKRSLAYGMKAIHNKDYRKWRWLRRIAQTAAPLLSLCFTVIALVAIFSEKHYTISEMDALPFLSLDVIEQNPDFQWHKDTYIRGGVDAFNNAEYIWSPLVPVHYDIYQQGEPYQIDYSKETGSVSVQPSARTEYFRLAIPALASSLFDEMLKTNINDGLDTAVTEIPHPAFDRVVTAKTGSMTKLFAVHGCQVISICYDGSADLAERLDLLAEAISGQL